MIRLELPYPISANRYWRHHMPKGFAAPVTTLSAEAKAFQREVQWLAKKAGLLEPLRGFLEVRYYLTPHRPQDAVARMRKQPTQWALQVQSLDLGNVDKVVSDALNGIAWVDDRQIERLVVERMEPGQKGLVVEIERYVPDWITTRAPELFAVG